MKSQFWQDETGIILSVELILILTLLIIGLVVGLSELQHAGVTELNDVGDAIGSVNQSFEWSGFSAEKDSISDTRFKSATNGSGFVDLADECDTNQCEIACDPPSREQNKFWD